MEACDTHIPVETRTCAIKTPVKQCTQDEAPRTSFQTAQLPAPDFALPSYVTLDLRAGLKGVDDRRHVAFFARNLTNRYYWTPRGTFVYDVVDTAERTAAMPL